jgi:glycosyltransferase involved in cell wall biosynthesis
VKVAVISDFTYVASTPDYKNCLSYYGSEPYHALVAKEFAEHGHDVHFFAPRGSEPIGTFHPLLLFYGLAGASDSIDRVAVNPHKLEEMLDFDFIIDMSGGAGTITELHYYHGFKNYACFRNGFKSYEVPRIPAKFCNHVVPSKQNRRIFKEGGHESMVCYYGIPDFYNPGRSPEYFGRFAEMGLQDKNYFLFPHRPTPDKGVDIMLQLARRFPEEKFVIAAATPVYEHQMHLQRVRTAALENGLKNLLILDMPLHPSHHYFKRELIRRAKALISPLGMGYLEGFGLSNAEAVACGTPLIISDSESTRELWTENDCMMVSGTVGSEQAVRNFRHHTFNPVNRFTTEDNYRRWMFIIEQIRAGKFGDEIATPAVTS